MRDSRRTSNYPERILLSNLTHMMSIADHVPISVEPLKIDIGCLTRRDREVVDFTRSRVKNISELTNLMKMYRIEGYNGK